MALQQYPDLLEMARISVFGLNKPLWFDEVGVPRFLPFHPSLINDIYADQAALVEIACQNCGKRFLVAMKTGLMDTMMGRSDTLEGRVRSGTLHYGDPPCWECSSGYTMNCEDIRVVEFWKRVRFGDWERAPELEIALPGLGEDASAQQTLEAGA